MFDEQEERQRCFIILKQGIPNFSIRISSFGINNFAISELLGYKGDYWLGLLFGFI